MWITPERVFYAGLLGDVSQRSSGAWMVYVALGADLRVALDDGAWVSTTVAVLPPYQRHRVACDDRLLCSLLVEPETVHPDDLPSFMRGTCGAVAGATAQALRERVRATHAWLRDHGPQLDLATIDFDATFFGHGLPRRPLDARVAQVVRALALDPSQTTTAQTWADAVGLSFSRFLHLFKQDTGVPFRSLRSWKRARSLLHHVTKPANLAHVALDAGYPDSTHFSHSIRQFYGLKPRDLFAGSRQLVVLGDSPSAVGGLRRGATSRG
ncbi:MAG: AraC family transcriptional regulator [Burkholderiales bacterium PBB5]|nr:MAG: AraC family transcriptional regulator [Burkholderiales bacterium PBB5]